MSRDHSLMLFPPFPWRLGGKEVAGQGRNGERAPTASPPATSGTNILPPTWVPSGYQLSAGADVTASPSLHRFPFISVRAGDRP